MTDITAATQNPAVDAASANPDVTAAQAAAPEVATLTPTEPDTVAAQAAAPEVAPPTEPTIASAQAPDPSFPSPAQDAAATEGASLAAEVKKGVEDFDRALSFVEQGVTLLGAAAKTELKMLAQKYL
ncbi:hypothetical protein [Pantoea sp.]|uniref:hypothetical protein n=1 Tax=Pantoea sp. TaxID=69393 RepID=UPI00289B3BCD|nr:hypothetical protein [Pantoea sp.]